MKEGETSSPVGLKVLGVKDIARGVERGESKRSIGDRASGIVFGFNMVPKATGLEADGFRSAADGAGAELMKFMCGGGKSATGWCGKKVRVSAKVVTKGSARSKVASGGMDATGDRSRETGDPGVNFLAEGEHGSVSLKGFAKIIKVARRAMRVEIVHFGSMTGVGARAMVSLGGFTTSVRVKEGLGDVGGIGAVIIWGLGVGSSALQRGGGFLGVGHGSVAGVDGVLRVRHAGVGSSGGGSRESISRRSGRNSNGGVGCRGVSGGGASSRCGGSSGGGSIWGRGCAVRGK